MAFDDFFFILSNVHVPQLTGHFERGSGGICPIITIRHTNNKSGKLFSKIRWINLWRNLEYHDGAAQNLGCYRRFLDWFLGLDILQGEEIFI